MNFSILSTTIDFTFRVNKRNYPNIGTSVVRKALTEWIESQYCTHTKLTGNPLLFSNRLFRVKVNRARNYLKAFSTGEISITENKEEITVQLRGRLLRGVLITALYSFIILILMIVFFTPLYWLCIPIGVVSYLSQIAATQYLIPRVLAETLQKLVDD